MIRNGLCEFTENDACGKVASFDTRGVTVDDKTG